MFDPCADVPKPMLTFRDMRLRDKLCILIVEDSPVFRGILKAGIPVAHQVYAAEDIKQGWAMFQDKSPQVVFIDINLPTGNGHDLARMIKKQNPDTYIVMATGSRRVFDKLAAAYNHVDGFIVKPFHKNDIKDALDRCLMRWRDARRTRKAGLFESGASA